MIRRVTATRMRVVVFVAILNILFAPYLQATYVSMRLREDHSIITRALGIAVFEVTSAKRESILRIMKYMRSRCGAIYIVN